MALTVYVEALMALTALTKKIRRFHAVHAQLKKLTAEADALKEYFRGKAGDTDTVFTDEKKGLEVPVIWKERTGWDGDKLAAKFGAESDQYKKTSRYAEVSCRKVTVKESA